MNNYKICQKLNYHQETAEKKANVDLVTNIIHEKMQSLGFQEVQKKDKNIQYVFSIGGDGTMLHTMHHHITKNSLVIGINAGNVGFLTPYNLSDVTSGNLFDFLENPDIVPRIEQRTVLNHIISGKKGIAVNDYAVTAEGPNDMLNFSIEVEHRGHLSKAGNYRANAFVLSGPCGSTAYNMNVGGAIVDPTMKCMQLVMIAPTTLGTRPLIMGQNIHLHVTLHNKAKIFSDGMLAHTVEAGEKMTITLMKKESHILVPEDWNFYSMLSKKLHWNNGKDV